MKTLLLASAALLISGSAFAQTPGFDPVKPFFVPAQNFNTAVQRTVGDTFTIQPTATAVGAPASIFNAANGAVFQSSVILGPIK